jgi:hypothetical protein
MWFLLARFLDGGWAISFSTVASAIFAALAGLGTGVLMACTFRPLFRRAPPVAFVALPALTLPAGIVVFSCLLWLARVAAGIRFGHGFTVFDDLGLILNTYLVYGLISIGAPLFFGLALANQYVLRGILRRSA